MTAFHSLGVLSYSGSTKVGFSRDNFVTFHALAVSYATVPILRTSPCFIFSYFILKWSAHSVFYICSVSFLDFFFHSTFVDFLHGNLCV